MQAASLQVKKPGLENNEVLAPGLAFHPDHAKRRLAACVPTRLFLKSDNDEYDQQCKEHE
jgi:hypothetical protein